LKLWAAKLFKMHLYKKLAEEMQEYFASDKIDVLVDIKEYYERYV